MQEGMKQMKKWNEWTKEWHEFWKGERLEKGTNMKEARKGREENEGAAPLFPCVFASIQRRGDHVRTRATLEQNKELKEQTPFFDLSSQEAF